MSAVSNSVMPRSIALWITLREVSRSVRWPKLLQPRPTAETRRPEAPRLRICMDGVSQERRTGSYRGLRPVGLQGRDCEGFSFGADAAHVATKRCGPGH